MVVHQFVHVPQWQRDCVESAFSGRSSRPMHTKDTQSRPVMPLAWQSVCLTDERGSKPLRAAIYTLVITGPARSAVSR